MLTLQFVPYYEIESLSSQKRVSKILSMVKENKIVMLEGRLRKQEEAELIQRTMQEINESFSGVEVQVIEPVSKDTDAFMHRVKKNLANILLGDRQGFTIIGPATVVKEIKRDPDKIQLLTQDIQSDSEEAAEKISKIKKKK